MHAHQILPQASTDHPLTISTVAEVQTSHASQIRHAKRAQTTFQLLPPVVVGVEQFRVGLLQDRRPHLHGGISGCLAALGLAEGEVHAGLYVYVCVCVCVSV
jgi:hypothetical protein